MTGQSTYPPEPWICSTKLGGCGKEHGKAHFAHPDQIDLLKKPGEFGRVKFNRRNKQDKLDPATPIRNDVPSEADSFDEEGSPKPLTCPHCGLVVPTIIIQRVGDLPSPVDQFLATREKGPSSFRRLLEDFYGFLKGRGRHN